MKKVIMGLLFTITTVGVFAQFQDPNHYQRRIQAFVDAGFTQDAAVYHVNLELANYNEQQMRAQRDREAEAQVKYNIWLAAELFKAQQAQQDDLRRQAEAAAAERAAEAAQRRADRMASRSDRPHLPPREFPHPMID